jgi:AbrB family looped-hinge helix DNA binding protein
MTEATVSSKNQIVIPREAREALNVKPGDKIAVIARGDRVILLLKPKSYRAAIRGAGRGLYPKGYLKKERKSWD